VLEVRNLRVHFTTKRGTGRAVDGVSFRLERGETLGLVGESGCGKSITALSVLGLNPRPASEVVGGEVELEGENLLTFSNKEMRQVRGKRISMILQDPLTSLNPVLTIGRQVGEPLRLHRNMGSEASRARVIELLRQLHIPEPESKLGAHPHEFSGGMRQRVVGATALAADPDLLIADEPTTALDVTLQAAFLAHLRQIQRERDLAILFITHDFSIVAKMCDRVAVMYAGKIVETGPTADILSSPRHPYTRALLESVPSVDRGRQRLDSIAGSPPPIYELPQGCTFAPRCSFATDRCRQSYPLQFDIAADHSASCWLLE